MNRHLRTISHVLCEINYMLLVRKLLRIFYLIGEVQFVNYINGLKKEIGLLINFGPSVVEGRRKYRALLEE